MKQGVWVPDEVLQDSQLTPIEKLIFSMIIGLAQGEKGCYATNQYLAERCHCSVTTASITVSKLIKLGYVRWDKFDGRKRYLKCSLSKFERQPDTNGKGALAKSETDNIYDFKTNKNSNSARRKSSGRTRLAAMERPPVPEAELWNELAGRNGNLV